MNNAMIAVGSNIDPEKNVYLAEKELKSLGIFNKKSAFIYTKPLLFKEQADFYNGVFSVHCLENYQDLKILLKQIEQKLGRVRTKNKNGPRTIDLDIVLFNNQIMDKDVFIRDFIKEPLLELNPKLQSTLNSKNYQKHFKEIKTIVDIIIETFTEKPIAIIGLGSWFFDKNNENSIIDIKVITCEDVQKYQPVILQKTKSMKMAKIRNNEVKISLLTVDELNKQLIFQGKIQILFGNIEL